MTKNGTNNSSNVNNGKLKVNREKITPMLIKCFWTLNNPNTTDSYRNNSNLPANEVQIYTWKDATLHEIKQLLSNSLDMFNDNTITIHFSIIYPDRTGNNVMRPVS